MRRAPGRRGRRRLVAVAALAGGLLGSGPAAAASAAPPRPRACAQADAGRPLQPQLGSLEPGEALCLAPGTWSGPLALGAGTTLWGPRSAVVRAEGAGTTVRLEADGTALLGLTVDGSGGRFDRLDAAVRVEGDDVRVESVRVENALFGILVEKSNRALLRGNEVQGPVGKALGLRGDGIRLWETRDSRVEANVLRDSRDLVVWYSPHNRFVGNVVERSRYGTHFMYSHHNLVQGARHVGNVVGVFAMYSRELTLRGNLFAESGGAAGVGLGCKESGNLQVLDNAFLANTVGVYLDTCPLYLEDRNRFAGNRFQFSDAAVVLHGSEKRNVFQDNGFASNRSAVRIEGRSQGAGVRWERNWFDGYRGYDLDGDGYGDVAHEVRSLESELVSRWPQLAFFRGTAAMGLVEAVGHFLPLFEPSTLLRDPRPRMRAGAWRTSGAD